jgi:hypothetical protein
MKVSPTMAIELQQIVNDFSDCLGAIDSASSRFKSFKAGVGPFGEPQLVKLVSPLFHAFEMLAQHVSKIELGQRHEAIRGGLIHPVHQQLTVAAWEVCG